MDAAMATRRTTWIKKASKKLPAPLAARAAAEDSSGMRATISAEARNVAASTQKAGRMPVVEPRPCPPTTRVTRAKAPAPAGSSRRRTPA